MKIDFTDLIKKSFDFTLKYKMLWVFGFIIAFFQSFSNLSLNTDRGGTSSGISRGDFGPYQPIVERFNELASSPIFIVAIIVIGIVILLLGWYLTRVSTISISRSVKHDLNGEFDLIKFGKLWNESHTVILKVILFDFLWFLFGFVLTIALILPFILLVFVIGPFAIILLCCGFLFFVPALIILSIINRISIVLLVNYNYSILDSVWESWRLLKNDLGSIVIYFFVTILLAIPFVLIGLFFVFVLALVTLLPVFLIAANISNPTIGIITILFTAILFGSLFAAVTSPFITFFQVLETKFVHALEDKNKTVQG